MRTRDPSAEPVIYTLSVQCVFGAYLDGECVRVIEIPDDATLEDLHFAIQEAVSFDNDHLYDFYAGRNYRNRKIEYTKAWDCEGREDAYAEICLRDVYPLGSLGKYTQPSPALPTRVSSSAGDQTQSNIRRASEQPVKFARMLI
ncbi:MAG: plasmid pRiA4b ORF-3 family protein [Nitrococcus sp.]|nr:plasmid pRiA4b ORF-3 family protein [Nitrococcus sp.]